MRSSDCGISSGLNRVGATSVAWCGDSELAVQNINGQDQPSDYGVLLVDFLECLPFFL